MPTLPTAASWAASTTRPGGLAATNIADLNQALRRNINGARGYQPPIELTAQRLRDQAGRS